MAKPVYITQGRCTLLQLKVAQILPHDCGHGHAQRGIEIFHRHGALLFFILKVPGQATGQIAGIARLVEVDG